MEVNNSDTQSWKPPGHHVERYNKFMVPNPSIASIKKKFKVTSRPKKKWKKLCKRSKQFSTLKHLPNEPTPKHTVGKIHTIVYHDFDTKQTITPSTSKYESSARHVKKAANKDPLSKITPKVTKKTEHPNRVDANRWPKPSTYQQELIENVRRLAGLPRKLNAKKWLAPNTLKRVTNFDAISNKEPPSNLSKIRSELPRKPDVETWLKSTVVKRATNSRVVLNRITVGKITPKASKTQMRKRVAKSWSESISVHSVNNLGSSFNKGTSSKITSTATRNPQERDSSKWSKCNILQCSSTSNAFSYKGTFSKSTSISTRNIQECNSSKLWTCNTSQSSSTSNALFSNKKSLSKVTCNVPKKLPGKDNESDVKKLSTSSFAQRFGSSSASFKRETKVMPCMLKNYMERSKELAAKQSRLNNKMIISSTTNTNNVSSESNKFLSKTIGTASTPINVNSNKSVVNTNKVQITSRTPKTVCPATVNMPITNVNSNKSVVNTNKVQITSRTPKTVCPATVNTSITSAVASSTKGVANPYTFEAPEMKTLFTSLFMDTVNKVNSHNKVIDETPASSKKLNTNTIISTNVSPEKNTPLKIEKNIPLKITTSRIPVMRAKPVQAKIGVKSSTVNKPEKSTDKACKTNNTSTPSHLVVKVKKVKSKVLPLVRKATYTVLNPRIVVSRKDKNRSTSVPRNFDSYKSTPSILLELKRSKANILVGNPSFELLDTNYNGILPHSASATTFSSKVQASSWLQLAHFYLGRIFVEKRNRQWAKKRHR